MVSAQFLRFGVAGAIGFVVDSLVLLAVTTGLGLNPYLGRAISFPVALTTTWLINRAWAFRQAAGPKSLKDLAAEYLNYWAVQMSGGAVNLATFALFVALFGKAGLTQVAAVAAGSVAGMFVNYFGNKALVFGANETVARMQRWTQRLVWLGVGTLILLIPAFLDGGPFIHFDSEQYFTIGHSVAASLGEIVGIAPAAAPQAPVLAEAVPGAVAATAPEQPHGAWASAFAGARSPFYALFLYLSSASFTLWGAVVPQAAVGAWLVSLLSAEFSKGFRALPYLALTAGLAVVSTIAYFAVLPMPDAFGGYFLLAALLFLLGKQTNRVEKVLLWGLMALCASFHTTINLMAAAMAVISALVLWSGGRRPLAALGAGALILLATAPGLVGGKIYGVASEKLADIPIYSPPFLTARVIGDGPGQKFLDEQCPTGRHDFAVCRFSGRKFRNHNHFLWGVPGYDSAYQLSDLQTQRKLGEEQIGFVLTVARTYPGEQIAASTHNAVRELFAVTVGREHHTIPLIIFEWPEAQVLRVAPQYERCAADAAACPVPGFMRPWETLIEIAFYLSLIVALAFAVLTLRRTQDDRETLFNQSVLIVIPVLLANAVICGVLSGVHARYQARVEWVLPALVLAASPLIRARFKRPKQN